MIELVTELIKIELQEFSLYVMVCIKNTPFGLAGVVFWGENKDMTLLFNLWYVIVAMIESSLTTLWEGWGIGSEGFGGGTYRLTAELCTCGCRKELPCRWCFLPNSSAGV